MPAEIQIEKLHLNTNGSDSYETQACAEVKLYIRGLNREETMSMSALTLPAICSPLPLAITVDSYPELCDLPLADECCKLKGEIDILIDSNFYWSIVTGEVVRGEGGLVAVNSKLGWLLSGPTDSQDIYPLSHTSVAITGAPNSLTNDNKDNGLFNSLREFWEVESLSIVDVTVKSVTSASFVPSISI